MELVFDRQKLMQNLQAAMEQRKVKANELETEIGVYSGYISRLKSEEAKLPSLDVIWKIAKYLKVNLMRLIEGTFERSTENLAYLEKFLQEVYARTLTGVLDWRPVHMNELNGNLTGQCTSRYIPFIPYDQYNNYGEYRENPCKGTDFGGSGISCENRKVKSFVLEGADVWLKDSCFYTDFGRRRSLYVAQLCGEVDPWDVDMDDYQSEKSVGSWYEFVVICDDDEDDRGTLICSTFGQGTELKYDAQTLFDELKQHEWDYRIEKPVRNLIDEFMQTETPATKPKVAETPAPAPAAGFTASEEDELPF